MLISSSCRYKRRFLSLVLGAILALSVGQNAAAAVLFPPGGEGADHSCSTSKFLSWDGKGLSCKKMTVGDICKKDRVAKVDANGFISCNCPATVERVVSCQDAYSTTSLLGTVTERTTFICDQDPAVSFINANCKKCPYSSTHSESCSAGYTGNMVYKTTYKCDGTTSTSTVGNTCSSSSAKSGGSPTAYVTYTTTSSSSCTVGKTVTGTMDKDGVFTSSISGSTYTCLSSGLVKK